MFTTRNNMVSILNYLFTALIYMFSTLNYMVTTIYYMFNTLHNIFTTIRVVVHTTVPMRASASCLYIQYTEGSPVLIVPKYYELTEATMHF